MADRLRKARCRVLCSELVRLRQALTGLRVYVRSSGPEDPVRTRGDG